MRIYRLAGVAIALVLVLGTSAVAFGDWGHDGPPPPEEVKPPGVTSAFGDIVNIGGPPSTGASGIVSTPLGTVNGFSETRSETVTPPNESALSRFPGVDTMGGHENITIFGACTPAGSPSSACAGTEPTGTHEVCSSTDPTSCVDAALDECNPCTMYNSSGQVIGTGSIDMPWWESSGHSAHQHVALLMHGTGSLTNMHGVLIHPGTTDPRCAAGVGTPHFVGCSVGTVHQDRCISGDWHGPLRVAPGQSACVLPGGRVFGPTSIGKDGELFAEGATFYGPISSDQGDAFSLCASTVLGPVNVTETTGPVMIGSPETGACGGNFIQDALNVEHNGCATCDADGKDTGAIDIEGDTVLGSLRVTDNVGTYVVGDFTSNNVYGPITEEGNS